MTLFVSYMPEERIEADAELLLASYAAARGVSLKPPIPVEEIVEKHLKLGIEFDNLHRLFKAPNTILAQGPDIIGAIFLEQRRIIVDEFLDPDIDPSKEGRYRFTIAHEVGHWRLHRGLVGKDIGETDQPMIDGPPSVICRSSEAKLRVELQADIFASCLLMPRSLVLSVWNAAFPDRAPRVLHQTSDVAAPCVAIERDPVEASSLSRPASDESLLDRFADPFAQQFLVSSRAMRVRLERLGLLFRDSASAVAAINRS